MSEYCVCCGEEIPEGRMICPGCESKMKETFGENQDFEDFILEDEYDGSYINDCKWEDGCGGCPYFDRCALVM